MTREANDLNGMLATSLPFCLLFINFREFRFCGSVSVVSKTVFAILTLYE